MIDFVRLESHRTTCGGPVGALAGATNTAGSFTAAMGPSGSGESRCCSARPARTGSVIQDYKADTAISGGTTP